MLRRTGLERHSTTLRFGAAEDGENIYVMPAQAGIQSRRCHCGDPNNLDSRFRGNDGINETDRLEICHRNCEWLHFGNCLSELHLGEKPIGPMALRVQAG